MEDPKKEETPLVKAIYTDEYFEKRYKEEVIEPGMLTGSLNLVKSYFIENKLEQAVLDPLNHPENLDQVIDEGKGFTRYCRAFKIKDDQAIMALAFAFNDFMIKQYGFKLYIDTEPEHPLRTMTLKYNENGTVMSLYPLEYTLKVLKKESSFAELNLKIKTALGDLPTTKDLMDQAIPPKED